MLIINTETKQMRTLHYGAIPDGWLGVPVRLEPRARAYCPFCELAIEDGALADILPLPKPEPEPPPPTPQEVNAQAIAELSMLQAQESTVTQQAIAELSILVAGGGTNGV